MDVLLTSGGTRTFIDDVRHVGNMSNGTFGNHICLSLLETGHNVNFLYAKNSKCPHEFREHITPHKHADIMRKLTERMILLERYKNIYGSCDYNDFYDYEEKFYNLLRGIQPELVIMAAAVSDYAPIKKDGKISSDKDDLVINMQKTAKTITQVKKIVPSCFLVGFKLLVNSSEYELHKAMEKQIESTGADMVVGNDLCDIKSNSHKLTIMEKKTGKIQEINGLPGKMLAEALVSYIRNRVS